MTLRLVHSMPDFFSFGGEFTIKNGVAFGCLCGKCERAIAAPFGYEGKLIWCLYCGMEEGFVPAVEQPFAHEYLFGVTREECLEDQAALARGDFEQHCERRARRLGRVIDLFG